MMLIVDPFFYLVAIPAVLLSGISKGGFGSAVGGLGVHKSNNKYMGFLGGINGFAAQIMRYPDEKLLVVVLSNFSFAPVTDIESDLADIVFSRKPR